MGRAYQQALSSRSCVLLSFSSNALRCMDAFLQVTHATDSPRCESDRRVLAYDCNEDATEDADIMHSLREFLFNFRF